MTIQQLEYFLAVVKYGTFSVAAKHCNITQPAMSIEIQNLENELGVVLLDRDTKPILPTTVGLPVMEQAKDTIASFYAFKEKVNEHKRGICSKLRLGIIPSLSPYLLPRFIPEFIKRCPRVELEIRDIFQADVADVLNRDLLDVAIISDGELPLDIRRTKLFDDKMYLYVSPENPLYEYDVISERDLDPRQMLTLNEGAWMRKKRYTARAQYTFVNTSIETLMYTVDNSSTVAMIPGIAIDYIPAEKHDRIKVFEEPGIYRTITMAVGQTCKKEKLLYAVQRSVTAVTEHCAPVEQYEPANVM